MMLVKNPKQIHFYLNNTTNVVGGLGHELLQARVEKSDNIFNDAVDWLDDAHKLGFNVARFSGGEPMLEAGKVCALIARAHELGMYTTLKTNGFWANDESVWKQLKASGLDFLRISYDSDWFYRGSPLTKQIAMKAIGDGRKLFGMFAIITDDTEPDIEELRAIHPIVEVIAGSALDRTSYKLQVNGEAVYSRHFTVDFKGRAWTSSTGIFKAEATGELDDRYLGSLHETPMVELYKPSTFLGVRDPGGNVVTKPLANDAQTPAT